MLFVLNEYIRRLMELEQEQATIPVLEFCIEAGSDISRHYIQLANFYKNVRLTIKL